MPEIDRPGGPIHYDVTDIAPPWGGRAETILFLHGLAIDSDIWLPWLPALVGRYRVVRVDLRGFGRSFVPQDRAGWTMEAIAGDVRAVMAAIGAETVHFIGESTGGTVGLWMALHQKEALASLTMVSAAHRGGAIGRVNALRDDIAKVGMDRWSEALMAQRFHDGALPEPMWRWFHDVQRRSSPKACVDLLNMLVEVDLTARLPEITTPTLLIAPDGSPFVTVESNVERLRALPNAHLHVIARSRHGVAFSHGAECAGVWLRTRSPVAAPS